MKKIILSLFLLFTISMSAQTHGIVKTIKAGDIFRDSLRFVTDSSHTPIRDSIHVINLGLKYDFMTFILLADTNTTRDSVKLTSGVIDYNYVGTAIDTAWMDEVWMKDSVGTAVSRAVSVTTNAKSWLVLNPVIQLLKVELVNHRGTVPTRVVHYRLIAAKREGF